jgi:hypothetical protein
VSKALAKRVRVMTKFKEEFDNARIALVRAKHIAHEFDLLFYTEENRQVVKSTAVNFFGLVYQEFREALILILCKLTDPSKQGKKKNLTAEHFIASIEVTSSPNVLEIKDIYQSRIVPLRANLIEYRNKIAAHSDYPTLMNLNGKEPSDKAIMDLLSACEDFYNEISIGVFGVQIMKELLPIRDGAGYLIYLLKNSQHG